MRRLPLERSENQNDEGTVERKVRGQLIYEGIHRPILERFLFAAENQATDEADFPIYRKLTNAFLTHLVGRLNVVTHQIFDLEFGRNESASNHGVFDIWHSTVTEHDYLSLIDKYPELNDLIETMVQQELKNLILVSNAFRMDYSRLIEAELLPAQNPVEITHIFVLTGESHEGGKNVVLFYVNGAPMFALKPRNVQIEARTNEFIRTNVAQWLGDSDWIFPKYLISDAWGWTSWHVPQSCNHLGDVSRYFTRVGVFSAFGAVLGITDLNAENVIARGASPVFIDLETVFHHQLNSDARWGVLSTGLFPTSLKYWGGKDLTESAGLMGTLQPPEGDDGIRTPSQEKAYVFLGDRIQRPTDFFNEIVHGFKSAALQILRNRADVMSFIDSCKNLTTRCILRPTAGYQTIVEQSYHPSLLCNDGKRAVYIEKCLDYAKGDLGNSTLIQAELSSAIAGDVPRFESTPIAPYVQSSYQVGSIKLDNLLTGYRKSCVYLEALTSTVIESEASGILEFLSQLKLIADSEIPVKATDHKLRVDMHELDRRLISLARRAADQILPIHTFRKTSYVGYMYEPLKIDLFSGLAGLAYFFQAYRRDALKEDERRSFATGFARRLGRAAETNQLVGGAYVGLCSAVLPFLALRSAVDPELFSHTVERLRTRIGASLRDRSSFLGADLVGGLSGALAVCTLTWRVTADARWLEIADGLYQILLDDSKLEGNIRYFPSAPGVSEHPFGSLSGLSHGQAGIAYALSIYCSCSPEHHASASSILTQAFQFEIENYDPALHSWRDYRASVPNQLEFNFS